MLINIAKQQLRKAGWYEGRKVDLTEYEEGFSNQGCEFFSAAKKFLEEFGDLDIQDKYWSAYSDEHRKKSILINRSIIDPIHCCFKPHEELVERIGKKLFLLDLLTLVTYIFTFLKTENFIQIGIIYGCELKTQTNFGMNIMVKTMVGQLGMI